ncbi:alginate lyase family protein [Pseudomonas sp. S44]|uniref:alginate lyase family protein n=1 Tax=Pseudomonas sp. S44 TaxID=2767450 RepID=UPI00190D6790|nr:alginate lyase family protein [Pseudomonas sp. S44]
MFTDTTRHSLINLGARSMINRLALTYLLSSGLLSGASSMALAQEFACSAPPPAETSIGGIGYYTDAAHSKVDPRLKAESDAELKPFHDFSDRLTVMTDDYLGKNDQGAGRCALAWLNAWASAGAMLGDMVHTNNDQPDYTRQWTHGTAALAYLKTEALATPEQRRVITNWLRRLTALNLAYWENPKHKRNNHYYWTGIGVMGTAVATHDPDLMQKAKGIYRTGINAIQPDGSLPMEMARKRLALHYHDYAIAPLVLMAELARMQGEDWYAYNDRAIERLADRVAEGYANPSGFERETGVKQAQAKPRGSSGWVEFYRLRTRHPELFDMMHAAGPFREPRLGGDLTLMASRGLR